jgi:hypothetical protein
MKKSLLLLLALTIASLCLNCVNSVAQRKSHRGFSINTEGDKTISNCGQITMRMDDLQVVRSEQERALPRSAVSSLQVQAALHGGIQVSGWDRDQYAIKACLGAAGENAAEAQRLLAQLALSVQDGRVTVTGPRGDSWMGYLIIQAPNSAVMELEAENSPIGVSSITANIEARNQNGPLTLRDVDGQVRADVQNGPITISGNRGEHRLKVENGPLTVELTGSRWESGELEGSTQNGPIVLSLPPDYQSAVRVDTSKHSPVVCRAAQCKESVRAWDKPHLIEFGGPNPVIRLSTVNGPTTVTSSGDK